MTRVRAFLAGAAMALCAVAANAANLTPPNLTQAASIADADLMVVWPTASAGPLEAVQWSVAKALMKTALGGSYLQVSLNLGDLASKSAARTNLGLGSAAQKNIGSSGATVPLINGTNVWSGSQSFSTKPLFPASASGAASINIAQGVAPTAPVNGDCWTTSTPSLVCYLGGASQTVAFTTSNITGSAAKWTTPRILSFTGDVTGSGAVDGSANVPTALTIANGAVTTSKIAASALASGSQVVAGTDTTHLVTPSALTSQQSLGGSGYVTLPGGLIEEWGSISTSTGANAVTFPLAFPSALYSVTITAASHTGTAQTHDAAESAGTTGFSLWNGSPSSAGFYWMAIGK